MNDNTQVIKLKKEIEQKKKVLIKKGIRENFGEKEIRYLFDHYPTEFPKIKTLIMEFEEWCINYEG